jgi:hypothetical protein
LWGNVNKMKRSARTTDGLTVATTGQLDEDIVYRLN